MIVLAGFGLIGPVAALRLPAKIERRSSACRSFPASNAHTGYAVCSA
jgi:hypothetical protein